MCVSLQCRPFCFFADLFCPQCLKFIGFSLAVFLFFSCLSLPALRYVLRRVLGIAFRTCVVCHWPLPVIFVYLLLTALLNFVRCVTSPRCWNLDLHGRLCGMWLCTLGLPLGFRCCVLSLSPSSASFVFALRPLGCISVFVLLCLLDLPPLASRLVFSYLGCWGSLLKFFVRCCLGLVSGPGLFRKSPLTPPGHDANRQLGMEEPRIDERHRRGKHFEPAACANPAQS